MDIVRGSLASWLHGFMASSMVAREHTKQSDFEQLEQHHSSSCTSLQHDTAGDGIVLTAYALCRAAPYPSFPLPKDGPKLREVTTIKTPLHFRTMRQDYPCL